MSVDWKTLARESGFSVSQDGTIEVPVGAARQTVSVDATRSDRALRLWTCIATAKVVRETGAESTLRYAWERNRFSDLIGFDVDSRGRLIGSSWAASVELSAEEFALHVRELARVANWHEFRLTGDDVY